MTVRFPWNSYTQSNAAEESVAVSDAESRTKIAIVSFLFNWPSTGGGIIHTVELAAALRRAGYDVRLIAPRYAGWRIGEVEPDCPFPVHLIPFAEDQWRLTTIQRKLREFVDGFTPDCVLITDSWNVKPHLHDALQHYPVFLRLQAQECLCPLNNLRMRPGKAGGLERCPHHQLAAGEECRSCLIQNETTSGRLHALERRLAGVGSDAYRERLWRAFREAEAVLVLNPQIAETLRPYCGRVEVVTWGMAPERFPPPADNESAISRNDGKFRILFAGLAREAIKGGHVLREAGRRLWKTRNDFEIVLTDTAPREGSVEPFERYVGWQTQRDLPRWYRQTDVTVVPTIVPDGLSRTAVEAMASARPVVASRIGGLPFTVAEGETGFLFEPGDAADLAAKLERLLDDPDLRTRMGTAGRREFERRFQWPEVIETQYRPLLETAVARRRVDGPENQKDSEQRDVSKKAGAVSAPRRSDCEELTAAFASATAVSGQMTPAQYFRVAVEILNRAPCRLLVFGAGRDTPLWVRGNFGGRTLVVEDDPAWREFARRAGAEVLPIQYGTHVRAGLLETCPDPEGVAETVLADGWDVVLVDGPAGWHGDAPGRQQSISLAARAAAAGATVFVHDSQRTLERRAIERYLRPPNERHGTSPQLAVFHNHTRSKTSMQPGESQVQN